MNNVEGTRVPGTHGESGEAGGSARHRADRLGEQRREIYARRSALGRAYARLFPSAKEQRLRREEAHWRTGAEGEHNLAGYLAKRCPAVALLHDRRIPNSRANVDHIAVAPTGIYVIDCKRYHGKIEVAAPLFGKAKLRIKGRDQTKLIVGLDRQVLQVRTALPGRQVPVHGCLCFVTPEGFLADIGLPKLRTLTVSGYALYHPRQLAKQLNRTGPLTAADAETLRRELARALPPAR